jgi:hypothetical protein
VKLFTGIPLQLTPEIIDSRSNGLAAISITSRGCNLDMPHLEDGINEAARYKGKIIANFSHYMAETITVGFLL